MWRIGTRREITHSGRRKVLLQQPHPEVMLDLECKEGGQQFEVGLKFNLQVADPKAAIEKGASNAARLLQHEP